MDYPAAIGAGLVSGAVTAAMLYIGIAMMPAQMKINLFYLLGSMMLRNRGLIYMAGAMTHGVMSIEFALIDVGIYEAVDLESNLAAWGLLFGFVNLIVSGMAVGMMSMIHPRIRSGELQAPGAYALSYPKATAAGFLMLHLVFGVLVGALYDAFGGV